MRWLYLASLLSLAPVAGCGLPSDAPPVAEVSGCVVPEGGWDSGEGPQIGEPLDMSISGDVVEAGSGVVPDGCFTGAHLGYVAAAQSEPGWIRIDDGDTVWTVGVRLPSFEPPTRAVTVRYQHTLGGFGPDVGALEIDGDTYHWIGLAGSLTALPNQDLAVLERGEAVFEMSDSCGTWRGYDLDASAGETAVVPYGETATIGDLTITHGGLESTVGSNTGCADWFVAHARVGISVE